MATIGQLRSMAKVAGIPAAEIRKARTAPALQELIAAAMNPNGASTKRTATKTTTRKPAARTTTRTPAKATATRKPATRTAVKKTTAKAPARKASTNGDAGRIELGTIDWNQTDGWNARPDSVPALIVATLKRFKGDREKVYNALKDDVFKKKIVGRTMADGSKRTLQSAQDMLRYRISRTAWDFAMKTGQHESATNRAEYGSLSNGVKPKAGRPKATTTRKAPARKTAGASRTPAKAKATATPTRKRTTAQKPVQRRTRAAAKPVARAKAPVAKKKARR